MKKSIIALFCLLALSCQGAFAKNESSQKVFFEPNWNKHKTITYRYLATTKNYENKVVKEEYYSKGLIVNHQVRKDKNSFVYEMQYLDTQSTNPSQNDPVIKKLDDQLLRQKVCYRVARKGGFLGIQDITQLQQIIEASIDEVLAGVSKTDTMAQNEKNAARMQQFKARFKETVLSQEFIENTYTEEMKSVCNLYGAELELNQPLESATELPNLFSGPTYPATCSLVLKEINRTNGICKGELRFKPVQAEFVKITLATLKKLWGVETLDAKLVEQMNIRLDYAFEYDVKAKIFTRVNYVKDVTNLDTRQVDETTLELVR